MAFPFRFTAKSEASTLLAVKQAAFIRNPEYPGASSGPDIITIGMVLLLFFCCVFATYYMRVRCNRVVLHLYTNKFFK